MAQPGREISVVSDFGLLEIVNDGGTEDGEEWLSQGGWNFDCWCFAVFLKNGDIVFSVLGIFLLKCSKQCLIMGGGLGGLSGVGSGNHGHSGRVIIMHNFLWSYDGLPGVASIAYGSLGCVQ